MQKLNHYMAYLRVAVEAYEEGRMSGFVFSQRLREPFAFSDSAELLLRVEDLLDAQDFPRAFQRKRTFGKTPEKHTYGNDTDEDQEESMSAETVDGARGAFATFAMNVITRQNTSWQGYLDWLDGGERKAFNSELELIALITEGLSGIAAKAL